MDLLRPRQIIWDMEQMVDLVAGQLVIRKEEQEALDQDELEAQTEGTETIVITPYRRLKNYLVE